MGFHDLVLVCMEDQLCHPLLHPHDECRADQPSWNRQGNVKTMLTTMTDNWVFLVAAGVLAVAFLGAIALKLCYRKKSGPPDWPEGDYR